MNVEANNAVIPAPAVSDPQLAQLVALLTEELITDQEIVAFSGRQLDEIEHWMGDAANLAEVQRATLELRNSGRAARLEAARHAREAVQVAVGIMRNDELHPSPRMAAAEYVAKVAGTMRPAADQGAQNDRIRITINIPSTDGIGESERVVIDAQPVASTETGDA
jgi:hypothetical protein